MDIPNENEFAPNSNRYIQQARASGKEPLRVRKPGETTVSAPEKPKHLEKAITGTARIQKKSIFKRFAENFLAGNITDVKEYVLMDVLIPAVKDTVSDMLTKSIEMMLFGETTSRSKKKSSGGGTYISYGSPFRNGESKERLPSSRNRMGHRFDDVVFDSRGDAENIVDIMQDMIETYGAVTMADFYDLCQITITWADDGDKWGWTDIRNVSVVRAGRDGYIIDLPKPIKL